MYTHSYIPPNINDNGNSLNGLVDTRRLIETVTMSVVIFFIVNVLFSFIPSIARVVITIVLCFGAMILSMIGIDGLPLSIGLTVVLTYRRNRCEVSLRMPMPVHEEESGPSGPRLKFGRKKGKK